MTILAFPLCLADAAPKESFWQTVYMLVHDGPFGYIAAVLIIFGVLFRRELTGKVFAWFGVITVGAIAASFYYQWNAEGRKVAQDADLKEAKEDAKRWENVATGSKDQLRVLTSDAAAAATQLQAEVEALALSKTEVETLRKQLEEASAGAERGKKADAEFYLGEIDRWKIRLKNLELDDRVAQDKSNEKLAVFERESSEIRTRDDALRFRIASYERTPYIRIGFIDITGGSFTDPSTKASFKIDSYSVLHSTVRGSFSAPDGEVFSIDGRIADVNRLFSWEGRSFRGVISEQNGLHVEIDELDRH